MEKIRYGGWGNCYKLANDTLEVIITGDVGPRIIRLAVPGEENLLKEFPEMMGLTGGKEWRIFGGHRLWHAPEAHPRTYHPDNHPVRIRPLSCGLRAIQEVESSTGVEKQIDLALSDSAPHVKLTHRIINQNLWPITLSAWALTVMASGGEAIIPLPPYEPHGERLSPSHPLVMWPYTRMNDRRWVWGEKYIKLHQEPGASTPQKIGLALTSGVAYYSLGSQLFVKKYAHQSGEAYPDFGCSFETFTDGEMLEMESLGPLTRLAPGEAVEHVEHWFVFRGIELTGSEQQIAESLERVNKQCEKLL